MNDYLRWNDALVQHFFRPEMSGRSVHLYVTNELISELGRSFDGNTSEFVAAAKEGPQWVRADGLCQRALQALDHWRERGLSYPPYVGYLALFVLAAGTEGDFAAHAYYPRLRTLLELPEGGMLPSFNRMLELWDDLERWCIRDLSGAMGIFTVRFVGEWIHVGVPLAQTILTDLERRSMPSIFWEAGFDPTSPPPDAELARALRTCGSGRLRARTLDLLRRRDDEEQYRILLDTVTDELAQWDGSLEGEPSDLPLETRAYGTLRLCLRADTVASVVRVTARCRVGKDFPEGRLVFVSPRLPSTVWCDEDVPGWSTPLADTETNLPLDGSNFNWAEDLILTDQSGRWHFKITGRPVRLFVEGRTEGLPGLVEVYQLQPLRQFYLLFRDETWRKLETWVRDECRGFVEYRISKGLPAGWRLASVERAISDKSVRLSLPFLSFSRRPTIRFQGGIRPSRGNTFFAFACPEFSVAGGDGTEEVFCRGLILSPSPETGRYRLPNDSPLDSRISIEVKRAGEVVARQSLYLTSDFAWSRSSTSIEFDRWGQIAGETLPEQIRIAGALARPQPEPGLFTISALMIPGLENRSRAGIFFVGRAPGEIVRWPAEPLPRNWQPVWSISLEKHGTAVYCGGSIDESGPLAGPRGSPASIRAWREILWHRRKRIVPPRRPLLLRLWRDYQHAASRA